MTSAQAVLAASGGVTSGEQIAFWVLAPLTLIGAFGMVFARSAVHSALFLVITMLCLGAIYVIQAGPYIGMVQIIVYTGAIMMLFLFVLMLVGRDATDSLIETLRGQRIAAIVLGVGLATLIGAGLYRGVGKVTAVGLDEANADGNVQGIAALLFTDYVVVFELSAGLLIIATIGAMLLAHIERRKGDRLSQVERMRARFAPGMNPAPKPGPGVYATSSSVTTPARLPDGTLSEQSIPRILPVRELTDSESAPKGTEK